jgi:hypothetical protein
VQEMALSQSCKIYIGERPPLPASNLLTVPAQIRNTFSSHLKEMSSTVYDLLTALLYKHAGDPHDYIFGLKANYPQILGATTVDYTRDIIDLYAEIAGHILLNGGGALMYHARHTDKRLGCPSGCQT